MYLYEDKPSWRNAGILASYVLAVFLIHSIEGQLSLSISRQTQLKHGGDKPVTDVGILTQITQH